MNRDRGPLRLALGVIGFTATISQLTLMRELIAAFYGNELLFGAVLGAWMAWTAVGAGGLGRLAFARQERSRRRMFVAGLALLGLLLPGMLVLARASRRLWDVTPGALVGLGPTLVTVIGILAPFCLISGALFTLGIGLASCANAGAGRAYVWESAGGVAGGMLFSFALIRWLDPFQIALLVTAVDWAVAAGLFRFGLGRQPRAFAPLLLRSTAPSQRLLRALAPVLLLLLTPLILVLGSALTLATLHWQWPHLVFAGDSPYGRITVEALGSERAFYTDGLLAFESQGVGPEEVVHYPLLAHPNPRRVLLIGGGVAGDLREILKHPVETVTYVELDPLLVDAARIYLPEADAAVLRDPRVRVITTDGRRYVNTTGDRFDVMVLDLPEPVTGALNRFYTSEFFAEARKVLAPGGVLALHLPSADSYWNQELTRRNASVYGTLAAAFPHVLTLPGERNFLLASATTIEANPAALARRLIERGVQTRWVTPQYLSYILTNDRFGQVKLAMETSGGARLNRDLHPISYFYGQALWASMLSPGLRAAFEKAGAVSLWWLAVPFILGAALTRWRRRWAIPFAVACAGLAGMLFELVIIFAFQVQHGSLYAEVGLIVAAYMGGLALGGSVANGRQQVVSRSASIGEHDVSTGQVRRREPADAGTTLRVVLGLTVAFAGAIPLTLTQVKSLPAPAFWMLALIAGCLGGMVYPLAVRLHHVENAAAKEGAESARRSAAAGGIYGADLLGGCLGALTGAALLIPVLGIPQTCLLVVLAALAGLAAMI